MVCDMADVKKSDTDESETSNASLSSCLRSKKGTPKKQISNRSVSFPEDDNHLVTGYLDPPNPWEFAESVSKDKVLAEYVESCERHNTAPIQSVIKQLQDYEVNGERAECLSLKGESLTAAACEALEEILKRIQLNTIDISNTSFDDEAAVVLFDTVEYYEAANSIVARECQGIGVRGWQACARAIKRSTIESLDASSTPLTEQHVTVLCRALRLTSHLRILRLNAAELSGRPLVNLVAALKMNKYLRELHLGENCLIPQDAHQLASLLKSNSTLQLLDLSNNLLEDLGVVHLCEALIQQDPQPGLAVLVLWNNKLSTGAAKMFSKTLLCVASLEVLNVGCNHLGDVALTELREALVDSRTLLRLGMQSTGLTNIGAGTLAEILESNTSLQRVDIRDNDILVDGLTKLVASLKNNKTLTRLDIDAPRLKSALQGEDAEKYAELWDEVRVSVRGNESEERSVAARMSGRKISLTCETLRPQAQSQAPPLLDVCRRGGPGGRLRSPAPSPIPSPVASPSPTRTRFQVSRVAEESSVPVVVTAATPTTPPAGSRFRVTVVEASSSAGVNPSPSAVASTAAPGDDSVVSRAGKKLQSWVGVGPNLLSESRTVEKLLGLLPWGRGPSPSPAAPADLLNNNAGSGATWPPHQPPAAAAPSPPTAQHSASTPSLVS